MRSRRYADEEEQTGADSGRDDFQHSFLSCIAPSVEFVICRSVFLTCFFCMFRLDVNYIFLQSSRN